MPTPQSTKNLRSASTSGWLVGSPIETIQGSKLPSNRQVLCNFLYFHLQQNQSISVSAKKTTRQILKFWEAARIPTTLECNIVTKVRNFYEQWRSLKKNKKRRSDAQMLKEKLFCDPLDNLFDIAHASAMDLIRIQEDKDFLIAQREKGRRGFMSTADMALYNKEERRRQREEKALQRESKERERMSNSHAVAANDDNDSEVEMQDEDEEFLVPQVKSKPSNKIDREIVGALDRTGVSDRSASYIVGATAKTFGVDVTTTAISRSSIRRTRIACREEEANEIRAAFNPNVPLTVHWDGKLLPSVTGKEKVDRLAIVVSGENIEKLLGVPEIQSGTGDAQATAVFNMLQDWHLADLVNSMCFDTTSSNTGERQGACVLLEGKLQRKLLSFACRHHVHELIVARVFDKLFGASSGPKIKLFERFCSEWKEIEGKPYRSGIQDAPVLKELQRVKADMVHFLQNQLQQHQPRRDYKELIELAILFLGATPSTGSSIKAPGACHRARWMAKIIYSLKIYLFRDHFHLRPKERTSLQQFNIFIIQVYIQHWLQAQCAASAPHNDLELLKKIVAYKKVNAVISKIAFATFSGHLWYLCESLVGLAFFDENLSDEVKKEMVKALDKKSSKKEVKRITIKESDVQKKQIVDFISEKTKDFFVTLEINHDIFTDDPVKWPANEYYIAAQKKVQQLKVVNDCAERGVALITSFNSVITKQESQKQFLLQVVEHHRKSFPVPKKSYYL